MDVNEEKHLQSHVIYKCRKASLLSPSTPLLDSPTVPLAIHWDGKLLPNITGKGKVDRLPVVVSGAGVAKLLAVPKLVSGTGKNQAVAVYKCVEEWDIKNRVKALVFDTTASNTGKVNGACTLLQEKFGHNLLHLVCRHHILEIILEKVYSECLISKSSGLEIALFQRFQSHFASIDIYDYRTLIKDEDLKLQINPYKDEIASFCLQQLKKSQPKNDYRELLELSLIAIGTVPPRGARIMQPGALHRARWMAKLIYSL